MLGQLNEKKSLIYFASGLRLNGVDNQAQLHATINAAIRAGVSFWPIDARGLVAQAPLGDATQGSPGGIGMYTGGVGHGHDAATSSGRRTRCTRWPPTPAARRCSTTTTWPRGSCRRRRPFSSYYIIGYYTTQRDAGREVPPHQDLARRRARGQPRLPPGLLRGQGVRQVHRRRQGAAARRRADAGRSRSPS